MAKPTVSRYTCNIFIRPWSISVVHFSGHCLPSEQTHWSFSERPWSLQTEAHRQWPNIGGHIPSGPWFTGMVRCFAMMISSQSQTGLWDIPKIPLDANLSQKRRILKGCTSMNQEAKGGKPWNCFIPSYWFCMYATWRSRIIASWCSWWPRKCTTK